MKKLLLAMLFSCSIANASPTFEGSLISGNSNKDQVCKLLHQNTKATATFIMTKKVIIRGGYLIKVKKSGNATKKLAQPHTPVKIIDSLECTVL